MNRRRSRKNKAQRTYHGHACETTGSEDVEKVQLRRVGTRRRETPLDGFVSAKVAVRQEKARDSQSP